MITTLRKNWVEAAIICFCVAVVLYQTVVHKDYFYPLYFVGCWLVCRFTLGSFVSKYVRVESYTRDFLLTFAPLYALGISDFFLQGHNPFNSFMSLFWFLAFRFNFTSAGTNRKTNWKGIYILDTQ